MKWEVTIWSNCVLCIKKQEAQTCRNRQTLADNSQRLHLANKKQERPIQSRMGSRHKGSRLQPCNWHFCGLHTWKIFHQVQTRWCLFKSEIWVFYSLQTLQEIFALPTTTKEIWPKEMKIYKLLLLQLFIYLFIHWCFPPKTFNFSTSVIIYMSYL